MQNIWIDNLPPGWKAQKLKYLAQFISGYSFDSQTYSNDGVPIVRIGDIKENVNFDELKKIPENIARGLYKFRISKNDILLALTGATIGKTAIYNSNQVALLNQRVAILRSNTINQNYLSYCIASPTFTESINYMCFGGAQDNIGKNEIGGTFIVFPDSHTQQNIISFLRNKISTIDQIIAKKQKLIDLLQEKRSTIINDAMANKNGEKIKIKHCAVLNPSNNVSTKIIKDEEIVSFVPMEAISETGNLNLQGKPYSLVKSGFTTFKNEDVVLAKITPCYENGKAGVIRGLQNNIGFGTTEFIVLRPNPKIIPDYLYYLIYSDSFRKKGEVEMKGSAGQKRVTSLFVANYEFSLPKISDQRHIIDELELKLSNIDKANKILQRQINYMGEYRTSLIYHAVTGKMQV